MYEKRQKGECLWNRIIYMFYVVLQFEWKCLCLWKFNEDWFLFIIKLKD
jgi:hypothetical protein